MDWPAAGAGVCASLGAAVMVNGASEEMEMEVDRECLLLFLRAWEGPQTAELEC